VSVRVVLISTSPSSPSPRQSNDDVATIEGLPLGYLNNAIAALRLSSLPSVVWWRGGPPDALAGVATLADRVVLDAENPEPLWHRAPDLFERTALTDVRWARLTRWRAVMAHFFDLAPVRDASRTFTRLRVRGHDQPLCALFAGWLDASLGWDGRVAIIREEASAPLSAVTLEGQGASLELQLLPATTCVSADARVHGQPLASRVVSLGDQSLPSLISQELRVRSRDFAFERALARTLPAPTT
jgi:glucose-6-phosphate dehydrogenase assembly protein OpcA